MLTVLCYLCSAEWSWISSGIADVSTQHQTWHVCMNMSSEDQHLMN